MVNRASLFIFIYLVHCVSLLEIGIVTKLQYRWKGPTLLYDAECLCSSYKIVCPQNEIAEIRMLDGCLRRLKIRNEAIRSKVEIPPIDEKDCLGI